MLCASWRPTSSVTVGGARGASHERSECRWPFPRSGSQFPRDGEFRGRSALRRAIERRDSTWRPRTPGWQTSDPFRIWPPPSSPQLDEGSVERAGQWPLARTDARFRRLRFTQADPDADAAGQST